MTIYHNSFIRYLGPMNKRLLIFSMHTSGGCFQYSNELIDKLTCEKEVWVPSNVSEDSILTDAHTLPYWGYPRLYRLVSLVLYLVYIYVGAKMGRFSALLLCGHTSWDYFVIKVWRHTGLPSFFIVHDGKMHTGEHSTIYQEQLTKIMQWSTHLVFLSEYVHTLVKENFGIDKPYIIAPHGLIDYGDLPEIETKTDKPTILFLGRVSKYKGVELLLDAIKQVPQNLYNKLVIAGKWSYDIPTDYDCNKVIIVDKWLSNDEILEFIAESDIMVFPYIEATQSGVATLAIHYLRPSVATNVGAFSEQFFSRSAVMVEPTVVGIRDGIIRLCSDKELYDNQILKLKLDRNRFSWSSIAFELQSQIYNVINSL